MENSATNRLFLPFLYKFTKEKTELLDKINQLLATQDMMKEEKNELRDEIELLEICINCLKFFILLWWRIFYLAVTELKVAEYQIKSLIIRFNEFQ